MLNTTSLFLTYFIADTAAKNLLSYKEPKVTYEDISFVPKERYDIKTNNNFDINSINIGKYTKRVKKFNSKLEKYFSPEELTLFHNNLPTLKIKIRFSLLSILQSKLHVS